MRCRPCSRLASLSKSGKTLPSRAPWTSRCAACAISCANTPDMMPLAIRSMRTACTALSSCTAWSARASRCWTPPSFRFLPFFSSASMRQRLDEAFQSEQEGIAERATLRSDYILSGAIYKSGSKKGELLLYVVSLKIIYIYMFCILHWWHCRSWQLTEPS